MKHFFTKIFSTLKQSCFHNGELSSTRVSAYIILLFVGMLIVYFITVGIYALIKQIAANIPGEFLVVFGSLLSHHLILLGINKKAETKIKEIENPKK